ncbi:MAG: CopD family protein [Thermoproteota archaeon]|nr:CopD family protein [Thermoproteota archaeon]
MLIFKIVSFILVISFIFSLYLVNFNIYAQAQVETTIDNTATSEAVTSINDAILKSLIIISQVAVLGITFNYFFFKRFLDRKRGNILYESKQNNVYSHTRIFNLKRVASIVIICCVSIIIFSTGSILLKSYQLAQNLEMDILSAFDILDSTSVGQVWIFRIVTSGATIGVMLTLYITYRKMDKENQIKSGDLDKVPANKISLNNNILPQILLLIAIALSSINLFSNSMVSHSNSLPSFSTFAVSMDWIHFMAVSIWIGGLFYLSLVIVNNLKPVDHRDDKSNSTNMNYKVSNSIVSVHNLSTALLYFSFIVIIALCIIGVSGLYLGYVHLQDLNSVFNTQYGQILVLKLASAFPLIFIGRYNQLKIYKYASITSNLLKDIGRNPYDHIFIQQHHEERTRLFRALNRSIKIESLLGITVLVVAALLSVTSPPSLEATNQDSFIIQGNDNMRQSNNSLFFYLVIGLAVLISAIGIFNFRRNQKQINKISISTK